MFDEEKAQQAVNFINMLPHTKGDYAGKPFELRLWQEKIIRDLFGNVNEDGNRQYKTAYIEIPRKNGKSELAAAIALKLLFADNEIGAEIYSAAGDREQASLVFNVAAQMVRLTPRLAARAKIIDSQKRIVIYKTGNVYRAISAESHTKHGFNAHGIIFDEIHVQGKRDLWDVLETSKGARSQPLSFAVTTAGLDRESICYELHEYSQKILSGTIQDKSFYPVIYSAEMDEDYLDEDVWHKCNPALGDFRQIDEMRDAAKKAKEIPAYQNTFRRLYLNQWVQQATRWIDLQLWEENYKYDIDPEKFRGRECYGGIDLSAVNDLTAYALIFPTSDGSGQLDILMRFWCPEDYAFHRKNKYASQYQGWNKQGFIEFTPGAAIDYDLVRSQIVQDASKYKIMSLGVDRLFQGYEFSQKLDVQLGGTKKRPKIYPCGMGFYTMSGLTKEFEEKLLKRHLNHGNNPVLRFNADSIAVQEDAAGNKKPAKDKSQGKIDGIIAVLVALDRYKRSEKARMARRGHGPVFI